MAGERKRANSIRNSKRVYVAIYCLAPFSHAGVSPQNENTNIQAHKQVKKKKKTL